MTVKAEKIAALPGKPFTHGRSAELYDLGDGKVLKLYFPEFPESDVDLEYNNTRIAFALGCTPMECYAKAECEGRFGVILKKVAGISMTKMPEKNPLILFKAGRLARRAKLRAYILALPAGNSILHYDFHTENILMDGKECIVIDWMTAVKGVPEAEVAMMDFLHHHAELFPGSSKAQLAFYTAVRTFIYNSFLKNYIKLTGMSPDAPKPWYVVALVMRRAWDIASEKEYLEGEIVRLVDEMK